MQKITPCFWFDGKAEEALEFYAGIFRNSRVFNVMRYGEAGPGPAGSVLSASVVLDGQEFMALNGGPMFQFTPAISLFVQCESQEEVDHYWNRLIEGGKASRCGWLDDKFGISWQIVPTALGRMLQDKNPAKANATMQAMLQMVKLDIAKLEEAYAAA
jgi:predicted 3-demethylubiquinone-9 3-methyltransferase (glyoxalase superfamily)